MMKPIARFATVAMAISLTVGCASTSDTAANSSPVAQSSHEQQQAVPQDAALRLTTTEVMAIMAGANADSYLFIDTRPETKYLAGHIPGAISIPKATIQLQLDQLPKDKTLVFYCGGLNCPLSPAAAKIAMDNGFTKVKVWYEGVPGWVQAGNYNIIETQGVQKLQSSNKPFVLVDSRPAAKFQKAFIPGAISIPKAEFPLKKQMLPGDKSVKVVFYCGGYHCQLSHESAKMAIAEGYKNVSVYAAGSPAWKQAGLAMWGSQGTAGDQATTKVESISATEFAPQIGTDQLTIIDVRTAAEFDAGHLPGAIHIFDEDFLYKQQQALALLPTDGKVVLVCASGARAAGTYNAIMKTDYANKANLRFLDARINYAADGSYSLGK